MYSNGYNWWLTKHGRRRFIERFGEKPDPDILAISVANQSPGYKFVWAPDRQWPTTGRRLVTVLLDESRMTKLSQFTGR